jgi:hypothetical protein
MGAAGKHRPDVKPNAEIFMIEELQAGHYDVVAEYKLSGHRAVQIVKSREPRRLAALSVELDDYGTPVNIFNVTLLYRDAARGALAAYRKAAGYLDGAPA